jgi:hypothetical protein
LPVQGLKGLILGLLSMTAKKAVLISLGVALLVLYLVWMHPAAPQSPQDGTAVGAVGSHGTQDKGSRARIVSIATTIPVLVRSSAEGEPLTNVAVTIAGVDHGDSPREEHEPRRHGTNTNLRGVARLPLQEPGLYRIEVDSPTFVSRDAEIKAVREVDGSFNVLLVAALECVAIEDFGGEKAVVFSLSSAAILLGRVVDEAGAPCGGLHVTIVPVEQIPSLKMLSMECSQPDSLLRRRLLQLLEGEGSGTSRLAWKLIGESLFKGWMAIQEGSPADQVEKLAKRPAEEVLEKVTNAFEGYAALSQGRQRIEVLKTDDNGAFRAEGISPGQQIRLTIFGTTTSGLRIIPYEGDLTIDAPGPHEDEFHVQVGCTLICRPVFPDGVRERNATFAVHCNWDYAASKEKGPPSFWRMVLLGPGTEEFEVAFLRSTDRVWLTCRATVGKFDCRGATETPELHPGRNEVTVDLSAELTKKAREATVVVIDEAGDPLVSGVCGALVRVQAKYGDTKTNASTTDERGAAKIVLERAEPCTLSVGVGGIVWSEPEVNLSPGDEYLFVFPEVASGDAGSARVKVQHENGEALDGTWVEDTEVFLEPAGAGFGLPGFGFGLPAFREEGGTFICKYLKRGEYTVRVKVKRSGVATQRSSISVRPGMTAETVVRVYRDCRNIKGRVLRGDDGVPNISVFLSGQTMAAGERFEWSREADDEGVFLFWVPLGAYRCFATDGKDVFATTRILVDTLGEPVEVELRPVGTCHRVEFKSSMQWAQGSEVQYPVRSVEVRGKTDGLLYWKHPTEHPSTRRRSQEEKDKMLVSFIAHLPKGEYRVTSCIYVEARGTANKNRLTPGVVREFDLTVGDGDQTVSLD